jgi:hypothetical protein
MSSGRFCDRCHNPPGPRKEGNALKKSISISSIVFALVACIISFGSLFALAAEPAIVRQFYVAYEASGLADGSSPANAAHFRDTMLWNTVRSALEETPVTVNFMPGEYIFSSKAKDGQFRGTFKLENIGHPKHQLILQGLNKEGTIFTTDPTDPIEESLAFDMFYFKGTNAIIRYFHFTGKQFINYVTKLYGSYVTLTDCTFIDMPNVIYGASGTHYEDSHHITVRDSVFIRIGFDSHAHMMYNAYGAQHVYVVNNYFEDCSGDYVRFRDRTDFAVVFGNTFKSTGTYRNTNRTFITTPLFNDDNPENPGPSPRFEYFGTHMLIAHNTFIYPDNNSGGSRQIFYFLNQGYDTPDRQFLLTVEQATLLLRGSVEEKKAFLKNNLGIDADVVFFYDNDVRGYNVTNSIGYYAFPSYGAVSRGWSSPVDITNAVVTTSVADTLEEALAFWDNYLESKRYFAAPRGNDPIDQPEFAVQLKNIDFPLQHIELMLDDAVLYAGNQVPTDFVLQTAALTTGLHQLTVSITDTEGKVYTDQTDFTIEYYRLANASANRWLMTVKETMPLYFTTVIQPEEYSNVTVQVVPISEGERMPAYVLYTGKNLPTQMNLDTMQYADGAYDLDVITTTTRGIVDHRMMRIFIDNWKNLEDPITAPVTSWFGYSERLLTVDRSNGWEFTTDNPTAFFGDAERIKPITNSVEYLTWQFANLHHFVFTVYVRSGQPTSGVTIWVSSDGNAWTEVAYAVSTQEQQGSTWSKLVLAGIVPAHLNAQYVKFQAATTDAQSAPELGHVLLYSLIN